MEEMLKATLVALADACNYSLHAHPPEEAVLHKLPTHLRGDARKALKKLVRLGFAQKHPTKGSMTYNITQRGILEAQQ